MAKIKVENSEITILSVENTDFISLTDMANAKESESRAADIIKNWIRTRFALEFLSTWELINNPNFKVVESDHFKMQSGCLALHSVFLSGLKKQMQWELL
jgi:hypothetical protein